MFSIYTLPAKDSPYWIFIDSREDKVDARAICDDFHKASGDFCTRVMKGENEVIIPREQVEKHDVWC